MIISNGVKLVHGKTMTLFGVIFCLLISGFLSVSTVQTAKAVSLEGSLVVVPNGTVYLIDHGTKRPFPSLSVLRSYGYDLGQVQTADNEDLALPAGQMMVYRDGTLVKDPKNPLVYLVTNGRKSAFESSEAFTGLGYNFTNIITAEPNTFADLPTSQNINTTPTAHPAGTLVNQDGTIYEVTVDGKMGFPTQDDFSYYGYNSAQVATANTADRALPVTGVRRRKIQVPIISSMNPASGPVGTHVIISGSGFNRNNTIYFGHYPYSQAKTIFYNVSSPDGRTLSFDVPNSLTSCEYPQACVNEIPPGWYDVTVSNVFGQSAPVSFNVTGSSGSSSITVTSPNGGEVWAKRTTQTVSWSTDKSISNVNIYLEHARCILPNVPCPLGTPPGTDMRTIAENIPNTGFYQWYIPGGIPGQEVSSNFDITVGNDYLIRVANAGKNPAYDYSDAPFSIVSASPTGSPVISGVSGPTTLKAGDMGTWTVNASDPNSRSLFYSVNWGDAPVPSANSSAPVPTPTPQQTATFTHTYSGAGTYTVNFRVSNDTGGYAYSSITVSVGYGDPAPAGAFSINPSSISLNVGGSQNVKAYYQAPTPPCPFNAPCTPPPDPVEVNATWSIINPDKSTVAKLYYAIPDCAPPRPGSTDVCNPIAYVSVNGVSAGTAELRATYVASNYPGGQTLTAAAKVSVGSTNGARVGSLINKNGTVYLVGSAGLYGIPDLATFNSWGWSFSNVLPANSAEWALNQIGIVPTKLPGCTNALDQIAGTCGTSLTTGAVTISSDPSSPNAGQVAMGQTGVTLGVIGLVETTNKEAVSLSSITVTGFSLNPIGLRSSLKNLTISDGTTVAGQGAWSSNTTANLSVAFNNLNFTILPNSTLRLIVKADINTAAAGAVANLQFQVGINNAGDVSLSGATSKAGIIPNINNNAKSATQTIVGSTTTNYHPADTNKDWRISIDELTAYGKGQYFVSANDIWKNGETYRWDAGDNTWLPTAVDPTKWATDSDGSPNYSGTYPYPITPSKYPDLFTPGVGHGIYPAWGNVILGLEPNPGNPKPTSNPYSTIYDYCENDLQLNEAFVQSDGKLGLYGASAPAGYVCSKGAFVQATKPAVTFSNPADYRGSQNFARGSNLNIRWAGTAYTSVSLALYQNGSAVSVNGAAYIIATVPGANSYYYDWTISNDLPLGDNYDIRITASDANGQSATAQSSRFSIVGGSTGSGTLTIDPASISLSVGGSQSVKAYYQDPIPACALSNPPCDMAARAPVQVNATWSASNENIARLIQAVSDCYGGASGCSMQNYVSVTGVSAGTAEIKASYTPPGGQMVIAKANVVVNSANGARVGSLINKAGTVYLVGNGGLYGIPDLATFNSWGWSFSNVLPANSAEWALSQIGIVPTKLPGCTNALDQIAGTCGITKPSITVVSPNGGEEFAIGNTYEVKWTSVNVAGNVDIYLGKGNGSSSWAYIAQNIPNSGSFMWDTSKDLIRPYGSSLYLSEGNDYHLSVISVNNRDVIGGGGSNNLFKFVKVAGKFPDFYTKNAYFKHPEGRPEMVAQICNDGPAIYKDLPVAVSINGVSNQYNIITILFGGVSNLANGCIDQLMYLTDAQKAAVKASNSVIITLDPGNFAVVESNEYNNVYTATLPYDGTSDNIPPKISLGSAPTGNIQVGQTVYFSWSATDANNDDLSWSVDWGEGGGGAGACQINPPAGTGRNWYHNDSHAWSQAGTYNVRVTVFDCKGGSDSGSFTVIVGGTGQGSVSVSDSSGYPNNQQFARGQAAVAIASFNLANSTGKDASVRSIQMVCQGCVGGSYGPDFANVKLYDQSNLVGDVAYASTNPYMNFSFSSGVVIPAGGIKTLRLVADIMDSSYAGDATFYIEFRSLDVRDNQSGQALTVSGVPFYPTERNTIVRSYSASPTITLTSPNGGEQWVAGTTQTIRWLQYNVDKVTIGYKTCDSCLDWIANNIAVNKSSSTGSYQWTIPSNFSGTNYRIDITGYNTGVGSANSKSAAPFSISSTGMTKVGAVTVMTDPSTPTAREVPMGQTGVVLGVVRVVETTNNEDVNLPSITITGYPLSGAGLINSLKNFTITDGTTSVAKGTWSTTSADAPTITFSGLNFIIPASSTLRLTIKADINYLTQGAVANTQFKVGVNNQGDVSLSGVSSRAGIIPNINNNAKSSTVTIVGNATQPSIAITSPNGGESWQVGEKHRITWNAAGMDTVRILLYRTKSDGSLAIDYIDGGAPLPAAQGYYDWVVPALDRFGGAGNNYWMRIENVSLNTSDTTKAAFSLVASPTVRCDYAAPPQGCSYVQGPNYDPTTSCGLVLNCPAASGGGGGGSAGTVRGEFTSKLAPGVPTITGYTTPLLNHEYIYWGYAKDKDSKILTYILDWGDGSPTDQVSQKIGYNYRAKHAFSNPGTYTISVYAQDEDGNTSGANSFAVTVR